MKKDNIKSIIVLTAVCLVVTLALSGINYITAPIIEKNAGAAADAAYLEVLPDATNFENVTGQFPETVLEMKKDLGGSGFAFKLQASSSYSQSPLQIIVGINNEGVITKLVITNYAETKGAAADFMPLYEGKDATLSDVLVGGCTFTSTAISTAVGEAYNVFFEYADVEKSDDAKFLDLVSKIIPNGADKSGAYTLNKVDLNGGPASIVSISTPVNGSAYVMLAKQGDTALAVGVNAYGKVYYLSDLDGNDLLADASYAQIIADAESVLPSIYSENNDTILKQMVDQGIISSASKASKVDFSAVNNNVVAVYKVSGGYAYVAKAEGFGGIATVCYVVNSKGDIVKYATLEQFEEAELHYLNSAFGTVISTPEYSANIVGKNTGTIAKDDILVAGSTFTSNAVSVCLDSVKEAVKIMNGEVA